MPRVILTTFATEGPPHDKGLPLAELCLGPFVAKVLESGVDEVLSFTPRTLSLILGEEKARRCTRDLPPPPRIICEKYHNIGAGAWKAEILKYAVEKYSEGDIVFFHDSNWLKYPGILSGFAPRARDYALAAIACAQRTKIFAPPHLTLIHTVTRTVFERLRDSSKTGFRHKALIYQPSGRARCIVLQITPETRDFVRKFAEACDVDENLQGGADATKPGGGWPVPGFIHNAGEQAVFNALVYGLGLWDVKQDDWIHALSNIGMRNQDTGSEILFGWSAQNRSWKTER